ncbi:MAG: SPOCS domain-containing protein [Lachnospiraceae bacterium]
MEITYGKYLEHEKTAGAMLQFPMEEEINLEQQMPDLEQVVGQNFFFTPGKITKNEGKICIQGDLEYQILYAPVKGELTSIKGSFPISQCIMMDYDPQCDVQAEASVSTVTIKRLNSRKLSIFVLMDARAAAYRMQEKQFIEDVEEPVEKKKGHFHTTQLVDCGTAGISIKDIIALPSNRPDVGRLIFYRGQLRGVELKAQQGSIWIKGELFVFLVYESGPEDPHIEYMELVSPVEGQGECSCMEGYIQEMDYRILSMSVSEAPNEDGEVRDIHMNMEIKVDYRQFEDREMDYLEDTYSLSCQMLPEYETMKFQKLLSQQMVRIKAAEIFSPSGEDRLLMVYPTGAIVQTGTPEVVEGGVVVEGNVIVDLLYIGTVKGNSPRIVQVSIPFHQQINDAQLSQKNKDQTSVKVRADTVQLSASILDGTQADVKVVINITASLYDCREIPLMTGLQTGELTQQKWPGLVGCVLGKEDTLWNLAKENRTTVDKICRINGIKAQDAKPGMQILVCQQSS